MINNRQRQFKKLMKEAERSKLARNPVYSYRDQRFEDERRTRSYKKPLLQIGGIASLLVLLWNLYAFSSFLFPWTGNSLNLSSNQLEVHQYIQESSEVESVLNGQVTALINRYNENSLTDFHIEEAQKELFQIQKIIETEDSRFLAMKMYLDEQFDLAYQATNVLKTADSKIKLQELEYILAAQNELLARKNEALISMLESEGLPYEKLEDGTISYQYEI